MRNSIWASAAQAGAFLLFYTSVHAQSSPTTVVAGYKPVQTLNCYKDVDPLKEDSTSDFASDGYCQQRCGALGKPVMALTGGSTCFCGDMLPPLDQQVDKSNCNSECAGYDEQTCGGIGFYQLYLTGLGGDIKTAPNVTDTSSSSSSSTTSSATSAPATVVVTSVAQGGQGQTGPNKVGIAVGVVVGLVAVAGIVGGAVFALKQRKRKAIEEEHKRNAAVNDFISSKRSEAGSSTDQRLDPSFLSSHRRESIGSIADEMDFSRRILQVRNPDHRASQASNLA